MTGGAIEVRQGDLWAVFERLPCGNIGEVFGIFADEQRAKAHVKEVCDRLDAKLREERPLCKQPTRESFDVDDDDEKLAELEHLFQIRWEADMRAIKAWQAANPGNDLKWPDHADLCVWLMDRVAELMKEKGVQ